MSGERRHSILELHDPEVYVVTARDGARENGQTVTWVLPATLVPDRPRVVVVLSRCSYTCALVRCTGRFAVNLLAEGQHALVAHFGLVSGREQDKLASVPHRRTPTGLAVLDGTCGWSECRVLDGLDGGDNLLFLAEATAQEVTPERRPLRLDAALAALPPPVRRAIEDQRHRDAERDRGLLRLSFGGG